MANPTAAILVIGDEILSGRTREGNAHFLAGELFARGIDLREVRIVADVESDIIAAVNALRVRYDHVFTSGGIGPTHDDITADAIARAFDVSISVNEEARAVMAERYDRLGIEFNEARLRMARIPQGATLIENAVSAAPGFSLDNVHVMAGVPEVFKAMVAVLMPRIPGGLPLTTASVRMNRAEGEVAASLTELAARYADLSLGSYPFLSDGKPGTHIVFRGADPARVAEAVSLWRAEWPDAV
jgi:molybdenum cofactor synthesis domain-containing protein